MQASYGDGSLGGGIHRDSFQAIAHYFQQRTCKSCAKPYTADGIEFLRQEPGVIVVKVGCAECGQPLGIALVGMTPVASDCSHQAVLEPQPKRPEYPRDWSKKDAMRFQDRPPISYDDVLAAHEFFSSLGNDWSTLLPAPKKLRAGKR